MTKQCSSRKSWQEKLNDSKGLPKVIKINTKMARRWGSGTMAIPAPKNVDEIMQGIPAGKVITVNRIREKIAKKHKSTICCPLTAGIFTWIAANAAEEAKAEGKKHTTPYWRTLKSGGVLNDRYPGGREAQKRLLEKEGHEVIQKGKQYLVREFEKRLVT